MATVFISYSHLDEVWKERVLTHLKVLEKEGITTIWHDRDIPIGTDWWPQIQTRIHEARVVVMLITANFLTSDFIKEKEMPLIWQRRRNGEITVIPVLVEPCAWQSVTWLAEIQLLPKDGKPLSSFPKHKAETELAAITQQIHHTLIDKEPIPADHVGSNQRMPLSSPRIKKQRPPRIYVLLAVLVLLVAIGFVLNLKNSNTSFEFTLYLKDGEGKTVLKKDQALLRMLLDNNPVTGYTDDNGAVDFKGIPPQFRGRSVPVELEVKRWTFDNGFMSTTCLLAGKSQPLVVQRDGSLAKLSGLVTDAEGRFMADAKVVVKGVATKTDQNGWFVLAIPPDKQEEKVLVTIQRSGYVIKIEYAYPGNKTNLVFILEKEKEQK